ncbi:MAG: hypothetical protein JJT81_05635 [Rubellimicrobium sp.]|nr:hypothetical protein [Rubellimicrobium sp.]
MRHHTLSLCLSLAILLPGPARAMLPPCEYDRMLRQAVMVLQIGQTEVDGPNPYGNCTLTGTVLRSFRGPIEVGTRVQTTVPCVNVTELIGPTMWTPPDVLRAAPVVELHIGAGSGPAAFGAGVFLLQASTEAIHWQPDRSCR